jgi:hypothetical protein
MAVVWVEDQPLGRECTMMFRNLTSPEMETVADVAVSRVERVMEATEDQLHHRLDLRVLLRQMLLLDRRMLASLVQTIVVVAEVVSVVSTLMPEDEYGIVERLLTWVVVTKVIMDSICMGGSLTSIS